LHAPKLRRFIYASFLEPHMSKRKTEISHGRGDMKGGGRDLESLVLDEEEGPA